MKRLLAVSMLALAAPSLAQEAPVTPGSIVAAAPAEAWVAIAPEDMLVMQLAPDAEGNKRTVTIQLMPAPFSQGWVGNIRTLAKAHWWDGTNVYRVQDNYVVQWGGGAVEKVEPEGLNVMKAEDYYAFDMPEFSLTMSNWLGDGEVDDSAILYDPYARFTGFLNGWPLAGNRIGSAMPVFDDETGETIPVPPKRYAWPTHCYGMVGVARGIDNTGSGSDLYVVIGHAPRQLDRNIAVVGRVIEGIEHLSSLPRGKGDLGFYDEGEEARRVPIVSARLGNEVQELPQPHFEYLSTESDSFARYVHARANRQDEFYKVPAGGVDICNVPVPVRRVAAE
jgi:peptidylprolyl isomerase